MRTLESYSDRGRTLHGSHPGPRKIIRAKVITAAESNLPNDRPQDWTGLGLWMSLTSTGFSTELSAESRSHDKVAVGPSGEVRSHRATDAVTALAGLAEAIRKD